MIDEELAAVMLKLFPKLSEPYRPRDIPENEGLVLRGQESAAMQEDRLTTRSISMTTSTVCFHSHTLSCQMKIVSASFKR